MYEVSETIKLSLQPSELGHAIDIANSERFKADEVGELSYSFAKRGPAGLKNSWASDISSLDVNDEVCDVNTLYGVTEASWAAGAHVIPAHLIEKVDEKGGACEKVRFERLCSYDALTRLTPSDAGRFDDYLHPPSQK
jgi:hypothetical protein